MILLKKNHHDNANLCFIDTDSLIFHNKTKGAFKDVKKDIKRYLKRPLLTKKNDDATGMMKDSLSHYEGIGWDLSKHLFESNTQ